MCRKQIHPNKKFQCAWMNGPGKMEWELLEFVDLRGCKGLAEKRDRLREAEQRHLDLNAGNAFLCNKSPNSRGPNNGDRLRKKWEDPEFRAKMTELQKNLVRKPVSEETRRKMAAAKSGARNHAARSVEVESPGGIVTRFPTVTQAAKALGVKQQVLDYWLKTGNFPGAGGNITATRHKNLIGYNAYYT